MKNNNLKSKALEAKRRLASGYFAGNSMAYMKEIENENGYSKNNFHSNGIDFFDEEKLYQIVCGIMRNPEIVINPIGCLMDKKKYEQMSFEERQRYVFKLSEIYIKLKSRYIKEFGQ